MKQIIQGYPGSFQPSGTDDSDTQDTYPLFDSDPTPTIKIVSVKFLVNPTHFISGVMRLKCVASSIPETFSRSHEEVILPEPARGAIPPGRYSSGKLYLNISPVD